MQFIDTHAHMYMEQFAHDLSSIIDASKKHSVLNIYMPNVDLDTIEDMMHVATLYKDYCLPMIGIHPCSVGKDFMKQLYVIEEWLGKYPFVGIGEIGLDLYHDATFIGEQKEAFSIQLDWAKRYNLPVSIHSRYAFQELVDILEDHQDDSLRGIIHCFTGTLKEAEVLIGLGFKLGIGGIITMPKNALVESIPHIDLSHLVLETDSPYLTPVPYRGRRNDPTYLPYIAEKIAGLKHIPLVDVATETTKNAQEIFTSFSGS